MQADMTSLQKICVVRCFRPDRAYNAVKQFVICELGEAYVQPPVLDYARIYRQSSCHSPMVFVLSPGADPQNDIQLPRLIFTVLSHSAVISLEPLLSSLISKIPFSA